MVAFSPMRDFLLLAKNLFVAATERGLRKHFAHFQANGGRKISEGDQIPGAYYRHCVRQLADAIGWTSTGAPFATFLPAAIGIRGAPSMVRLKCPDGAPPAV